LLGIFDGRAMTQSVAKPYADTRSAAILTVLSVPSSLLGLRPFNLRRERGMLRRYQGESANPLPTLRQSEARELDFLANNFLCVG